MVQEGAATPEPLGGAHLSCVIVTFPGGTIWPFLPVEGSSEVLLHGPGWLWAMAGTVQEGRSCCQYFQEPLGKVKGKDRENDGSALACSAESTGATGLCKLPKSNFFHLGGAFAHFRTAVVIIKT